MVVVFLAPFALILAAAIAAAVVVRRSSLRITIDGVEVHNYSQAPRLIPLAEVGHFEPAPRSGNLSSVRPATAVLVLVDGSRVPVHTLSAPDAGHGVDALNRRVEALRNLD